MVWYLEVPRQEQPQSLLGFYMHIISMVQWRLEQYINQLSATTLIQLMPSGTVITSRTRSSTSML